LLFFKFVVNNAYWLSWYSLPCFLDDAVWLIYDPVPLGPHQYGIVHGLPSPPSNMVWWCDWLRTVPAQLHRHMPYLIIQGRDWAGPWPCLTIPYGEEVRAPGSWTMFFTECFRTCGVRSACLWTRFACYVRVACCT